MIPFLKKFILFILVFTHSLLSIAQKGLEPSNINPEWTQAYPPFKIAGNLYYVGTYELASYLIVTSEGSILINSGLSTSTPIIRANLETLGFKLGDIKILLTTQAHYDHVGALAEIKKLTGAKMFADVGDVEALQDGGRSDYALTDSSSLYTPIGVDRVLYDRQTIRLGEMQILMLHHPGHTRGSCSYILRVKDDNRSYKVLIANMPSIIIDIPFSQVKTYPNIARDYAHTLTAMKKLSFDLWLASHASQFDLHRKHKPGKVYNPLAFMDRKGYEDELNDLKKKYWRKLKDEKY